MTSPAFGAQVVSPLRETPKPHHPDQMVMFHTTDVDTTFATADQPMTMTMAISLYRLPRIKCEACGSRRVCYYIGLGALYKSPTMCAKCSGIR